MNSEHLLHALTDLEEDLILDANCSSQTAPRRKPKWSAVLTAAVLAATLISTCFASMDGAGWFRRFFAAHSGEDLSEGKNAYLGQSAAAFQQSYTKDGFTIALESALSDGVTTIIQFRVDAPEGTKLDAQRYGISNWMGFELAGSNGETLRDSGGWDTYDEDPNDRSFSLLYSTNNHWYEPHVDSVFGTDWTLRIEGITAQYLENLHTEEFRYRDEPLVTGPWEFTVTLPESGNQELQFIREPVNCSVTMRHPVRREDTDENGQITPSYYQEEVAITSLRLRALSCAIDFQSADGRKVNADFEPFAIVMQDGSQVLVGVHHSGLLGTVGYGGPGFLSFNLGSPLVLEEVSHILLPDGTRLKPTA